MEVLSDEYFMRIALKEAMQAFDDDEVPVGAIIVSDGRILARTHNLTERLHDVTAHAEMMAFTSAASALGGKYLENCTLYVTLEMCPMCAGAAYWTRISRIVTGAADMKRGYRMCNEKMIHPATKAEFGILEDECAELLTSYFRAKRG